MTYRVRVRMTGTRTYEIDAKTAEEAEKFWAEGVLVYDDMDDEEIVSVRQIDIAEAHP